MREPDLVIGPPDNPQTLRWHLLKWRGFQLALHKWLRSDDDRARHDHKAWNISILLNRRFFEVFHDDGTGKMRWPLIPYFRRAETPHRIVLLSGKPVWTLWLRGPEWRDWGFWCPKGWRSAGEYLASRNYYADKTSTVGRGCD